jgi:hypothetical protein
VQNNDENTNSYKEQEHVFDDTDHHLVVAKGRERSAVR